MSQVNKVGPAAAVLAFRNLFDAAPKKEKNFAVSETTKGKSLKRFQSEHETVKAMSSGNVDDATLKRSIKHYEKAYDVFTEAVEKDWDAKWITKEMIDDAMNEIDKAIELNPSYAGFYIFRGALYAGKGKFQKAQDDFSQAIALKPDFSDEHFDKGTVFLARASTKIILSLLDMYGSAIDDIEKAGEYGHEDAEFVASTLQEIPKYVMMGILFKDADFDDCEDCDELSN